MTNKTPWVFGGLIVLGSFQPIYSHVVEHRPPVPTYSASGSPQGSVETNPNCTKLANCSPATGAGGTRLHAHANVPHVRVHRPRIRRGFYTVRHPLRSVFGWGGW